MLRVGALNEGLGFALSSRRGVLPSADRAFQAAGRKGQGAKKRWRTSAAFASTSMPAAYFQPQ